MAKRIQRKRVKGWKMPENAVYVGRPTKWGNPYPLEGRIDSWATRMTAVEMFREKVAPHLDLSELRGKDLACWCRPDQACHADVLLEMINNTPAPEAGGA